MWFLSGKILWLWLLVCGGFNLPARCMKWYKIITIRIIFLRMTLIICISNTRTWVIALLFLTMVHIKRNLSVFLHAEGSAVWQLRQLWCLSSLRRYSAWQRPWHVCQVTVVHSSEWPPGMSCCFNLMHLFVGVSQLKPKGSQSVGWEGSVYNHLPMPVCALIHTSAVLPATPADALKLQGFLSWGLLCREDCYSWKWFWHANFDAKDILFSPSILAKMPVVTMSVASELIW